MATVFEVNVGVHHTKCGVCVYQLVTLETGEECASGDQGEICVRGPQLMLGYLNNAAATAQMIDSEGWLHTGLLQWVAGG